MWRAHARVPRAWPGAKASRRTKVANLRTMTSRLLLRCCKRPAAAGARGVPASVNDRERIVVAMATY